MHRPVQQAAGGDRRSPWAFSAAVLGRLVLALLRLGSVPFRPLPRANIGTQITLLTLVTTLPFLLLIITWSLQDAQGAAHTIAGLVWATGAAIGLGALSHRRLSLPIVQLSATARRIGAGDFSVRAPFHRGDELGQLASAMDAMAVSIESLTGELRDTRDRVAHTVTEVGRLATSAIDADALWPLLAEIAQRLTAADGSALYVRDASGALRLRANAGLTMWPARGDLATRVAMDSPTVWDAVPVWADQRMAVQLSVNREMAAVLEVYRVEAPFPHDTGRLLAVFARQAGLTIERTELRRQAAEAYAWEQTSRTQGEFIVLASHELRNPVASLRSYAEALQRPEVLLDDEERRYCLERVEHLSGRLGDIVRNLLSVSRIRSGQLQVELTTLDPAALVRGVAGDMRHRDPTILLLEEIADDLPAVQADPVCLEEIIVNLLNNAFRHSPVGGQVWLRAEVVTADGALRLRLHVQDSGPGLSREQQSRLFQRFVRFDSGHQPGRVPDGLGLGLYICQAYAHLMQGSICVASEPGKGARFTLELPAVPLGERGASGDSR